jgi:hypothetical protein
MVHGLFILLALSLSKGASPLAGQFLNSLPKIPKSMIIDKMASKNGRCGAVEKPSHSVILSKAKNLMLLLETLREAYPKRDSSVA